MDGSTSTSGPGEFVVPDIIQLGGGVGVFATRHLELVKNVNVVVPA